MSKDWANGDVAFGFPARGVVPILSLYEESGWGSRVVFTLLFWLGVRFNRVGSRGSGGGIRPSFVATDDGGRGGGPFSHDLLLAETWINYSSR